MAFGEHRGSVLPKVQRLIVCKKKPKTTLKEKHMTHETIQEQIVARAMRDPSFRQALLNDPRVVLAAQYNVHLPEGVAVRVLEEAPNTLTLVLPKGEEAVVELTDAELLGASGRG